MTRLVREIGLALLCLVGLIGCTDRGSQSDGRPGSPTSEATLALPPPPNLPPLDTHLLPLPQEVTTDAGGAFRLTADTPIVTPADNDEAARIGIYLAEAIARWVDVNVEVVAGDPRAEAISLELVADDELGEEAYEIAVTATGVRIIARRSAGLFRAVQTMQQILPTVGASGWVPGGRIVDHPRFPWRGAMLDVARHFFDVDEVKRYIDLIALYRMNVLHLHLTDDQGWRIAIDSWPRLATHGGSSEVGGGSGGFYTKAEYAEIVSYAADRYITVVPEIDMPGHTNAALAAYGELNCDGQARDRYTGTQVGFSFLCVSKEVTYRFVDDVIGEIAALTPGPYIHIGGDEVQRLSGAEYKRFVEQAGEIVASHGKRLVGWQEIAEAHLDSSSVVQFWNPHAGPEQARLAAEQGASLVLSPADHVYLDMKYDESTRLGTDWAGHVDVAAAYQWDPATLLEGVPDTAVLGIEAPLWTETVDTINEVEHMAFPRLPAAAEVGWSDASRRRWSDFRERLAAQAPLWSALDINYYAAPGIPWPD